MSIRAFLIIIFMSSVTFGQDKTDTKMIPETLDASQKHSLTKDFIAGKVEYRIHELFTEVNLNHASKVIYLNKEVYHAFVNMFNHAKANGISLKIISGTRNFDEQKTIWQRKWNTYKNLKPTNRAKKILNYSAMPSASRHHWGTDIDLNSLNNAYFEKGQGKKVYEWLLKNANNYGFYQVYSDKKDGRRGYNLERWHWSYMPLASIYLSFYNKHMDYQDILGFEGSELAKKLNIITNYVNGISKKSKLIPSSQK